MTSTPPPRFADMINHVVDAGACTQCGTCVAVCSHRIISVVDGLPAKQAGATGARDHCGVSAGIGCDACASVCPRLWPRESVKAKTPSDADHASVFGTYRHVFVARTRDAQQLRRGQDGGVVTALLAWARQSGLIDAAVVASVGEEDQPCFPTPKIATSVEQIEASAGSWYTYCPNNLALADLSKAKVERAAFVGVSCQMAALNKMQRVDPSFLATADKTPSVLARQRERLCGPAERVSFSVGLFCTEVFRPELMTEYIAKDMGIALDQIERVNVKGELLIHRRDGVVASIPLEQAKQDYMRPACQHCGDFAAEMADISCGGIGTDKATVVVLRTDRGVDIWRRFEAAGGVDVWPIAEHERAWKLLQRLAHRQRERVPAAKSPGGVDDARSAQPEKLRLAAVPSPETGGASPMQEAFSA